MNQQVHDTGPDPDLRRELSLLDSTMINVGSMIGSGIFIVPAVIAMYLQSSSLIIFVWIVGGVVSLFGALSVAELGALMPRAGGQYVYLREAYSPLWGFLYGWSAFAVINTASIAAVAVTCAAYLGYFFPLSPTGIRIVAIASILLLTAINCYGIKLGALVQNGFTLAKIGALTLLAGLSFILSGGSISNFSPVFPTVQLSTLTGPLGLAMVAVLWSYDGWIEITYVAGEVKDPQRVLPRSLIIATMIVILSYVLINCAYMFVLSLNHMSHSELVASDSATKIMGPIGASLVAVAVIVSTFGANNGFIFTCPRIYYAMAKEGMFFRWLGNTHPTYRTPIPSLLVQALLACMLILTGTFDQLTTYVVFASWIFYAMSCGAVFLLRKKSPNVHRSYKTWGYPITPLIFIIFSLYLVVTTIIEDPRDALIGVGIILLGVPAYLYWKKNA
ncbi:MAG: amino acid permease [Ignavibacteria bacterium]|nr:amino acid permease [Ignavibacteria bacterium]